MNFYKYNKASTFKEKYKTDNCKCDRDNKVLFFTPCYFNLSKEAAGYLSLLYEPKHELKYQCASLPTLQDRDKSQPWDWEPVNRRVNEHFCGVRRVWAAFGKPGGGWEFTGSGDMGRPNDYRTLPDGGFEEEYGFFVSPVVYARIQVIRATIRAFIQELIKEKEFVYVKEFDDSPAWAIYFRTDSDMEFTVSVALKNPLGVRIWGVFWEDNDTRRTSRGTRILSPIITVTFPDWKISTSLASETMHEMVGSGMGQYDPDLFTWLRNVKDSLFSMKRAPRWRQQTWKRNILECPKDWSNYIWHG